MLGTGSATLSIANDWNITFGEIPSEPSTTVTFHGIILDFERKSVSLSPKALGKLARFDSFISALLKNSVGHCIPMPISAGEIPLLKILGTATFWSRALFSGSRFTTGCMASRFQVMQFIRAVCRAAASGEETFQANRGAIYKLQAWIAEISSLKTVSIPSSTNSITITSDASTTGGGYVITHSTHAAVTRLAFPWRSEIPSSKIGKYELRAIAVAIANVEPQHCLTKVEIFTDSTTAIGSLQKGYSASRDINDEVARIYGLLSSRNLFISSVSYVNTKLNVADCLSRAITSSTYSVSSATSDLQLCWVWEGLLYGFIKENDGLPSLRVVVLGPARGRPGPPERTSPSLFPLPRSGTPQCAAGGEQPSQLGYPSGGVTNC